MADPSDFDSFDYHAPNDMQLVMLNANRDVAKAMRETILGLPQTRERALALTKLEEALTWANKAVFAPAPVTKPR